MLVVLTHAGLEEASSYVAGRTLLLALLGFRLLAVAAATDGGRKMLIESAEAEGGCPVWGVCSRAW